MSENKSSKSNLILIIAVVIVALLVAFFLLSSRENSQQINSDRIQTNNASQLIQHAQGSTEIPVEPQRIIVFDIAALSVLDALKANHIIGVAGGTGLPESLHKYKNPPYQDVGTLFEPNYEMVNAAQPDLIITGGRSSAKYPELSKIAATIDMPTDEQKPVQSAIENARLLAKITNTSPQVEALITQLNQSIDQLKNKTANRGKGLIVLVTGGKLSAYGAGSRFGIIHTDFGVPQAVEGLATTLHGEAISSEFIQKTNPDWLFVIDRDAAIGQSGAAKQVIENPLVKTTNAWKNQQVVYLQPLPWYLVGEGIVAVQQMTDEISQVYSKSAQ